MTKNQIAISLFALLLIGIAIYSMMLFSKITAPEKRLETSQQPTQEYSKLATLNKSALNKGWGRNPFFFPGEKAVKHVEPPKPAPPKPKLILKKPKVLPVLKLEMIFEVNGEKRAILSGQSVKEGDTIGSEIVAGIGSDDVLLKKNGKQRRIKMDTFSIPFRVE